MGVSELQISQYLAELQNDLENVSGMPNERNGIFDDVFFLIYAPAVEDLHILPTAISIRSQNFSDILMCLPDLAHLRNYPRPDSPHRLIGNDTVEVSASMLTDMGCSYTLTGHSERRSYYGETSAMD